MRLTKMNNSRYENTERQLEREVDRIEAEKARAKLVDKIQQLESQGYHNQFEYKNYGVQYNPIYDKDTGRVKTIEESGLTPKEYANLATNMATAPEMSPEWNEERARKIANEIFDTMSQRDIVSFYKHSEANREKFIELYVNAVKNYNLNDEDFNYEVIKSIWSEAGGASAPGVKG